MQTHARHRAVRDEQERLRWQPRGRVALVVVVAVMAAAAGCGKQVAGGSTTPSSPTSSQGGAATSSSVPSSTTSTPSTPPVSSAVTDVTFSGVYSSHVTSASVNCILFQSDHKYVVDFGPPIGPGFAAYASNFNGPGTYTMTQQTTAAYRGGFVVSIRLNGQPAVMAVGAQASTLIISSGDKGGSVQLFAEASSYTETVTGTFACSRFAVR